MAEGRGFSIFEVGGKQRVAPTKLKDEGMLLVFPVVHGESVGSEDLSFRTSLTFR